MRGKWRCAVLAVLTLIVCIGTATWMSAMWQSNLPRLDAIEISAMLIIVDCYTLGIIGHALWSRGRDRQEVRDDAMD